MKKLNVPSFFVFTDAIFLLAKIIPVNFTQSREIGATPALEFDALSKRYPLLFITSQFPVHTAICFLQEMLTSNKEIKKYFFDRAVGSG